MKRKLIPWFFIIQCMLAVFLLAIFGFCLYWTIVMIGSNQNATSFPIYAFVPHLLFVAVLLTPLLATSIIHVRLFARKDLDSETFRKQMKMSFYWQLAALAVLGGVFVFAAILSATRQSFFIFHGHRGERMDNLFHHSGRGLVSCRILFSFQTR